jgi:hypothetical protein
LFPRSRDDIEWAVELDNAYNLAAALAGVDGPLDCDFLTRHFPSIKSKKRLEPATAAEPTTLAVKPTTFPIPAGNDFTSGLLRKFPPAVGLSFLVWLFLWMWNIQMHLSHISSYIEINTASNQILTVS